MLGSCRYVFIMGFLNIATLALLACSLTAGFRLDDEKSLSDYVRELGSQIENIQALDLDKEDVDQHSNSNLESDVEDIGSLLSRVARSLYEAYTPNLEGIGHFVSRRSPQDEEGGSGEGGKRRGGGNKRKGGNKSERGRKRGKGQGEESSESLTGPEGFQDSESAMDEIFSRITRSLEDSNAFEAGYYAELESQLPEEQAEYLEGPDSHGSQQMRHHHHMQCCGEGPLFTITEEDKKIMEECFKERNITVKDKEGENKTKGHHRMDPCIMQCYGNKTHLLDKDGKLIKDKVRESTLAHIVDWLKPIAEKHIDQCVEIANNGSMHKGGKGKNNHGAPQGGPEGGRPHGGSPDGPHGGQGGPKGGQHKDGKGRGRHCKHTLATFKRCIMIKLEKNCPEEHRKKTDECKKRHDKKEK
ncbi:uncharacterized protein [Periplaneta americana]|uniref:uncharacterized protein n=1 Tax=Periplaneta americana TaxID=6978 RepID=UPI0037E72376